MSASPTRAPPIAPRLAITVPSEARMVRLGGRSGTRRSRKGGRVETCQATRPTTHSPVQTPSTALQ